MEAKNIKQILTDRGIKQQWLANKLGVSKSLISKWLNGHVPICEKHIENLKKLFN